MNPSTKVCDVSNGFGYNNTQEQFFMCIIMYDIESMKCFVMNLVMLIPLNLVGSEHRPQGGHAVRCLESCALVDVPCVDCALAKPFPFCVNQFLSTALKFSSCEQS